MRLHASPTLMVYIRELLQALDESKGQSWAYDRTLQEMANTPPNTFESEWAVVRNGRHVKQKVADDEWARECLERVKHRMRWELYGFLNIGWLVKLRSPVRSEADPGAQDRVLRSRRGQPST